MINKLLCGKIGCNLQTSPITFVTLLVLLLVCLLNEHTMKKIN